MIGARDDPEYLTITRSDDGAFHLMPESHPVTSPELRMFYEPSLLAGARFEEAKFANFRGYVGELVDAVYLASGFSTRRLPPTLDDTNLVAR